MLFAWQNKTKYDASYKHTYYTGNPYTYTRSRESMIWQCGNHVSYFPILLKVHVLPKFG